MKEYAVGFYKSQAWKKTQAAYKKSKGGLCELCYAKGIIKAGEIVHHKVHITPENITDTTVTLNWDNLQLVCRDCHAQVHEQRKRRFDVDEYGRVIPRDAM